MANRKNNISDDMIIEAIQNANGILSVAAKSLSITRKTVYDRMANNPAIKEAYETANETTIDFVESALLKRIQSGDTTAIIFFLKTRAKSRGYVERIESTGANGGAIEVNVRKLPPLPDNTLDDILNASTDET